MLANEVIRNEQKRTKGDFGFHVVDCRRPALRSSHLSQSQDDDLYVWLARITPSTSAHQPALSVGHERVAFGRV